MKIMSLRVHNRPRHEYGHDAEQPPIYEGILSVSDRAVMANFVANLTGYGPNSDQYKGVRSKFVSSPGKQELPNTYVWLGLAIEARRGEMGLPTETRLTPEDSDRLVAGLLGDEDFIKSCAWSIEDLSLAVDYGIKDKDIPSEHLPSSEAVGNFTQLREVMVANLGWQNL